MAARLPDGTTFPRGLPKLEAITWPLMPSRELFELRYGKALVEADRRPGNIPVYGTNGQCGTHDTPLFSGPGVILGRKGQGPLGVEWAEKDYWVIDTAYSLSAIRPDIDLRYAYFLIKHVGLNHLKDGTSNPSLSRDAFGAQAFPFPPLEHQRAIAHILGTLDDKIELNRRMNEMLEAIARALFKSWFIDFDPVQRNIARREGRGQPSPDASRHPLPLGEGRGEGAVEELDRLFPDRFEDSELGEIPKGWRGSRLGSEVATVLGGTPSRAEPSYWGGHTPWINSGKANEFRVVEPSEFLTQAGLESSATKLLPSRTTVIAITGATLGQVSLTEIETCANQSIVGVIGTAELPSEFLYFWVKENIDDLLAWQTGGAQQHINKNNVNDIPVLCPADAVIEAYHSLVRPVFDRIKECCFESRTLAAIRDALLPKLISGELRVKDAAKTVERIL